MDLAKDGPLASCTELAIWIPGRVAAAVVRDPELSQHLLDSVLKPGNYRVDLVFHEPLTS